MPLYAAIVSALDSASDDAEHVLAQAIANVFKNRLTYCSARAQMFVYDPGRGFWNESVLEHECVERALRDIAGYIDTGAFKLRLARDESLPTQHRAAVAARARWLREKMLRSVSATTVVSRLREIVSH